MPAETCGARHAGIGDDIWVCTLPAGHADATEDQPGTPHEDSEHLDSLSGEPWRWWG